MDEDECNEEEENYHPHGGSEQQALMVVPAAGRHGAHGASRYHLYHRHHYITRYVRHRQTFHVQLQTFGASLKCRLGGIVSVLINRTRRTHGNIMLTSPVPILEGTSL